MNMKKINLYTNGSVDYGEVFVLEETDKYIFVRRAGSTLQSITGNFYVKPSFIIVEKNNPEYAYSNGMKVIKEIDYNRSNKKEKFKEISSIFNKLK